jgi:hypothetical protein
VLILQYATIMNRAQHAHHCTALFLFDCLQATARDSALASHMGGLLMGSRAQKHPFNKSVADGLKGAATDQGIEQEGKR